MLLSPGTTLSVKLPFCCALARILFCRCKYNELTIARTTMEDANPIRTEVALRYLGASVVGKSQLHIMSFRSETITMYLR